MAEGLKLKVRKFWGLIPTFFRGITVTWEKLVRGGGGLRPTTLLKKRLWYRCFPVNFVKFLRTPLVTASGKYKLINS